MKTESPKKTPGKTTPAKVNPKQNPSKPNAGMKKTPNTPNKPLASPNQRFQQQNFMSRGSSRPFNKSPQRGRGSRPFNRGSQPSRPFNRGSQSSRPFNRGSQSSRPFNRGFQASRPFNRGSQSSRPFNRGSQQSRPYSRGSQQSRPFNRGFQQSRPYSRGPHQSRPFNRSPYQNRSFDNQQSFNNNGNQPSNSRFQRNSFRGRNIRGARTSFNSNNRFTSPNPRFNQSQGANTPNNRGNFVSAQQRVTANTRMKGVKRSAITTAASSLPGETFEKRIKFDTPEKKKRTLFVGNVPLDTKESDIRSLFSKHGKIESIRFRGIPRADMRQSRKVALFKKNFHPNRNSMTAYVVFATKEEAEKAQEVNGQVFKDHCLRVNMSTLTKPKTDTNSIFVSNLPFDMEDDDLITLFKDCGPIHSVRISRDLSTSVGRGFGYVNFKSPDGVELALQMENITFKKRVLRIKRSDPKKHEHESENWTSIKIDNLPQTITRAFLLKMYKRCGKIINITFHNKPNLKNFKSAIVAFETAQAADYALNIRLPLTAKHVKITKDSFNPHKHIFIRDLPLTTNSLNVKAALKECGPIKRCKLLLKPQPPHKTGFGIVEFDTVEAAENAVKLKTIEIKKNVVKIESYIKDQNNAKSDDDDDDENEEQQNGEENDSDATDDDDSGDEEMEQDDDDEEDDNDDDEDDNDDDDDDNDDDDDDNDEDNENDGDNDNDEDEELASDVEQEDDDNSEQEGDDDDDENDDDDEEEDDDDE